MGMWCCREYALHIYRAFGVLIAGCELLVMDSLPHLTALEAASRQLKARKWGPPDRMAAALTVWSDTVTSLSDLMLPTLPSEAPVEWRYPPLQFVHSKRAGKLSEGTTAQTPPTPSAQAPDQILVGQQTVMKGMFD